MFRSVFPALAVSCLMALNSVGIASAADISIDSDGNIRLTGMIDTGDAARFKALLEREGATTSTGKQRALILDSEGGYFLEADALVDVFWQTDEKQTNTGPLATVVPANGKCLAACTLLFLHGQGKADGSIYPTSRHMHSSARLGFGHPPLSFEPGTMTEEQFKDAVATYDRILFKLKDRGVVANDLFKLATEKRDSETFDVATVDRATRWEINVFTDSYDDLPDMRLSDEAAYLACTRFNDPEFRRRATSYRDYLDRGFRQGMRKTSSYLDSRGRLWKSAYSVPVTTAGGERTCRIWEYAEGGRRHINIETGGVHTALLPAPAAWLHFLPPGLPISDIPSFLQNRRTPRLTLAEEPGYTVCNGISETSNVRAGAAATAAVIDAVANGQAVDIVAMRKSPSRDLWFQIAYERSGRLYEGYIEAARIREGCGEGGTRGMTSIVEVPDENGETIHLYSDSYALVIGIDDYERWPKLRNAARDAQRVAETLKQQGFDVQLVTSPEQTTSEALDVLLKTFFLKTGDKGSRLVFWFAGHGHSTGVGTSEQEGYIVPLQAALPNTEESERDFQMDAISLQQFDNWMRRSRAKHVLAVFDSCFSGSAFTGMRSGLSPAITRATDNKVRQIITSGDADQEVSDDGLFMRLFTGAILGKESEADANKDGYVTGSELGLFLQSKITNLTDNAQTPRYGVIRAEALSKGDTVFALEASGETDQAQQ